MLHLKVLVISKLLDSFWELLKITFNRLHLLFLKINLKLAWDDSKGNLNEKKLMEMKMHN